MIQSIILKLNFLDACVPFTGSPAITS